MEIICENCGRNNFKSKGGLTLHKKKCKIEVKETKEMNKNLDNIFNEKISVSSEVLKSKIHSIHNMLRNNGAGYGMNALKIFNLIYGLKKIEENNLIEKLNLSENCKFSNLLKLVGKDDEKTFSLVYDIILKEIKKSSVEHLLYYKLPEHLSYKTLNNLIIEVNKISEIEKNSNVLLSGKIYEYFVGRDRSAISELGAYFTDRPIVEFIFSKIKLSKVETMVDMFGGSGGFTTGYIDYVNKNFKVNWKEHIDKIFHYDINADVIKSAGLEMFCLTNEIPPFNNLKVSNAFEDSFNNKKFSLILTNPPYGGDTLKNSEEYKDNRLLTEKLKELLNITKDEKIIKNIKEQLNEIKINNSFLANDLARVKNRSERIKNFAAKYGLKANDKEGVSLILLMELLEKDGTCCGVLKEGVFFSSKYKNIRKCLLENFNVEEIIDVPNNVFENTVTKTSIIIFKNNGSTKKIKFSKLTIETFSDYKFSWIENRLIITEKPNQIKDLKCETIKEVNVEFILKNVNYSLFVVDYNTFQFNFNPEYALIKIKNLCKFMPKSKRKAAFGGSSGEYNFYTSSEEVKKCDVADYKEQCLIVGSGGKPNIKISSNFSCSADNFILYSKYNIYIYCLIICKMSLLESGFRGSVLNHISKNYLENLEIPFNEEKADNWTKKILNEINDFSLKQLKLKKKYEKLFEEFTKDIFTN